MRKVLDNGTFRAYIYANDNPNHLLHCHVDLGRRAKSP
jgi:hypothetical protein